MKKNSLNERQMVSPAEVESLFSVPRGSLANLRCARRGPRFFKVGGRRVLYRLDDIRGWVESHPVLTKEE